MTVQIRSVSLEDIGGMAKVYVDSWRKAHSEFAPGEVLKNLSYERSREYLGGVCCCEDGAPVAFVAEVDDDVVGFCIAGCNNEEPLDYDASIHHLFVLPEYRNHGIGMRLLHAVATSLQTCGADNAVVTCYGESSAPGFYELLGGELVKSREQVIGDTPYELRVYGWDLRTLANAIEARFVTPGQGELV